MANLLLKKISSEKSVEKFSPHNQGRVFLGIVIIIVVVGVLSGSLYFYFQRQLAEIPDEPVKEEKIEPGEIATSQSEESPEENILEEKAEEEPGPGESPGEIKTSCQDECSRAGLKKCSDNGYQICDDHDAGGCLEWGPTTECPQNTICQNGNCSQKKCSDGAVYGQCSTNKPKYCENGTLINKCSACGCPAEQQCQTSGSCIASTLSVSLSAVPTSGIAPLSVKLIAQISGINAGPANYIFYCDRSDPGTNVAPGYNKRVNYISSSSYPNVCNYTSPGIYTTKVIIERGGLAAESRITINVDSGNCSDGTFYGQCSESKPKYCDNGTLINKCSACGCPSGQQCQADESCNIPTLSVSLSASPSSGNVPLNDVDLTAIIPGTTFGPTNYTFYCNRSDSGTNIISGYVLKKDGITSNSYNAPDICDYSAPGTYTAKVIVEKGSLVAENRTMITVSPALCLDGTLSGQCSITQPKYCDNETLINKCSVCGCPSGRKCQPDESCINLTPIAYPIATPVLVLKYFPLKDGRLDLSITGMNDELSVIREKTNNLVSGIINLTTKASIYYGYKNPGATPSLKFSIFEEKEFLEALPIGKEIPWKPGQGIYRPDYYKILSDINICDYVDNKGIKFVWVVGYHYGSIEPVESNMSMGKISKDFWNFATYGDISNSEMTNDLPICEKTYVLENLNFSRDVGIEGYGHHMEAVFRWIDYGLFWGKFVGPYGSQSGDRRCGWMHYSPNAITNEEDYDFWSERYVESDCEDWKPDGSGLKNMVNCHTWYGSIVGNDKCEGDTEGFAFQVWWAQNLPGYGNTLVYNGKLLRNWWDFIGDFDQAMQIGKSLTY